MGEITAKTKFQALYIDPICRKKIQYWANAASGEVSGLGLVENEDGKMVVREVYILEQECTGADTELDPEAISKLMTDLMKDDKDPAKLKFWWHSHVNMGCFWSGTDDTCAETLSSEFAFSTVVNKAGESKTRLDLYAPFRITVDNIRLMEIVAEDENLKIQCEQDVKDKVKEKSWNKGWRNHQDGRGYFDRKGHESWGGFGGYGGGRDPYDYDEELYKDKNSKIKLKEDVIDDIKILADFIFDHGFTSEAMRSFVYEIVQQAIKRRYEDKAECKDGIGTWEENQALCVSCKVAKECKIITQKFEGMIDENDFNIEDDTEIIPEGHIEVIVDTDS